MEENGPFIDDLAITLGIFHSKLWNYQRVKKQFEWTSQTLLIPTILQFSNMAYLQIHHLPSEVRWFSQRSIHLQSAMGISQPRHDTERVKIFRYRQVKDQILPRMLQLLGSAAPKVKVQAAGLGWSRVASFCITICHYMMSRYVKYVICHPGM